MLVVKYKFLISGNEYMQVSFTETGNILRDRSFCLPNWKPQFYSLLVLDLCSVFKAVPWTPVWFLKAFQAGGLAVALIG